MERRGEVRRGKKRRGEGGEERRVGQPAASGAQTELRNKGKAGVEERQWRGERRAGAMPRRHPTEEEEQGEGWGGGRGGVEKEILYI